MDEAVDVFLSRDGVRHSLCAEHVRHIKDLIIEDRTRYVAFGSKMHDHVRTADELAYEIVVCNVPIPELESLRRFNIVRNVIRRASVGQRIEHNDVIVRILPE